MAGGDASGAHRDVEHTESAHTDAPNGILSRRCLPQASAPAVCHGSAGPAAAATPNTSQVPEILSPDGEERFLHGSRAEAGTQEAGDHRPGAGPLACVTKSNVRCCEPEASSSSSSVVSECRVVVCVLQSGQGAGMRVRDRQAPTRTRQPLPRPRGAATRVRLEEPLPLSSLPSLSSRT